MKIKFFLLILLLNNTVYCQYKEGYSWNSGVRDEIIKCYGYNCQNGIYSQMEDVKCTNCAGWADSYRNSRGCDVCHNNKYINKRVTYTCYTCNGLGKVRNTYYTKENIADREKSYRIQENKKKCEELETLTFPDKDQIASDLIGKKISGWNFDKLEEFKDIRIKKGSTNINYDNPEESSFEINVDLELEDYKTKEFYVGDVVVNYKFKDHKWFFSEIISGNATNFEGEERIGAKNEKITIKKDDYYFDAPNVKVHETKSSIEFEITNGKVDVLNQFLTAKRKEILGVESWSYLTSVKAKYDGYKIKEVKIKGDGSTINLTINDGERFQVAEEFAEQMKARIKY